MWDYVNTLIKRYWVPKEKVAFVHWTPARHWLRSSFIIIINILMGCCWGKCVLFPVSKVEVASTPWPGLLASLSSWAFSPVVNPELSSLPLMGLMEQEASIPDSSHSQLCRDTPHPEEVCGFWPCQKNLCNWPSWARAMFSNPLYQ